MLTSSIIILLVLNTVDPKQDKFTLNYKIVIQVIFSSIILLIDSSPIFSMSLNQTYNILCGFILIIFIITHLIYQYDIFYCVQYRSYYILVISFFSIKLGALALGSLDYNIIFNINIIILDNIFIILILYILIDIFI